MRIFHNIYIIFTDLYARHAIVVTIYHFRLTAHVIQVCTVDDDRSQSDDKADPWRQTCVEDNRCDVRKHSIRCITTPP